MKNKTKETSKLIFFLLQQNTLLKWYKKRRTAIPKDKSEKVCLCKLYY